MGSARSLGGLGYDLAPTAAGPSPDECSGRPGPQNLASGSLEPTKHCINQKAARVRGLPFSSVSLQRGAKKDPRTGVLSKQWACEVFWGQNKQTYAHFCVFGGVPLVCEVCFVKIVVFGSQNKQTYPYFCAARRKSVDAFAFLAISRPKPHPGDLQTYPPD